MKFRVTRTSLYDDKTPPFPEAKRRMFETWDMRRCASAEEFDLTVAANFPKQGRWLEHGTEHQTVRGPDGSTYIKRRLDDRKGWFVELASLDELLAFADKHGELVVDSDPPSVEIYDDYRE